MHLQIPIHVVFKYHIHTRLITRRTELLFLEEQNYFFWKVLERNQRIDMSTRRTELLFLEEQNYFFWKVLERNQRIDMKPEDS